jgi:predicted ATP-dependent endonuclease of OLD family
MKLVEFEVEEFRSVWNSKPIKIDDVTCLVGKNEAGKTALLTALYRLNPIISEDDFFDVTDDYPRKEVGDYQHQVATKEREPAKVIRAKFELDKQDIDAVGNVFGKAALASNILTVSKGYNKSASYHVEFDDGAARNYLAANTELPDALREKLIEADNWKSFSELLAAAENTAAIAKLKELLGKFKDHSASHYAYNSILRSREPKFLYFDEYYQLAGHENIPALIQRKTEKKLLKSDYPLLGLINIARLKLEDLLNAKRTTELTNTLEGAGNHLTRQILKYWSQNKHLQMKFDVREAKPEDPPHMRTGVNIWGKVYDTVHWATTELGSRSRGFVWFFSFLAWYEDVKRSRQNVILLLDEPGLSLHGKAQADLLRYIEDELKPHHQVIYTTHSPFMVDSHHFERVRIVQDAGIDAIDPLPKGEDGTKVLTEVFDASEDSLFPLQGALGYEIHQTLFIGPNSLVVEGPADLLFLNGMSSILEREGKTGLSDKWTITPVGGSGRVPTFVALLAPQKGLSIATLIDMQSKDRQAIEGLYKKKLLEKKRVLTYADFTGTREADVEDMFDRDFYLQLVNAEFANQISRPLTTGDLNNKIPRTVSSIEDALKKTPLKSGEFGHYRPARYFTENLQSLKDHISPKAKERFEAAFTRLNALLK